MGLRFENRIRLLLAASSVFLILTVLGFNAWLNISSFRKNYANSLAASYTVAGGDCRRKIEYAVKYGKPLTNFYGIEDLLNEVKKDIPDIEDVRVILPDGNILYDISGSVQNSTLPGKLLNAIDFHKEGGQGYTVDSYGDKYHVFLPIHDRSKNWIGTLDLIFDGVMADRRADAYLGQNKYNMSIVAALASLMIVFSILAGSVLNRSGGINTKRLLVILLVILGAAQLAFGAMNIYLFDRAYADTARETTTLTARIIQKDIDYVLGKGVSYSRFYDIDKWLGEVVRSVPEIESVHLTGNGGYTLFSSPAKSYGNIGRAGKYSLGLPLMKDSTGASANIEVILSDAYLKGKIKEILIDALTVMITSFFFMVELALFMLSLIEGRAGKKVNGEPVRLTGKSGGNKRYIRPLAFIFYIASFLPFSFIPLQMKELYEPIRGLSRNIVMGLPISIEFFCSSVAAITAGYVIDKKGWRHSLFTGMAIFAGGSLLSGFAGSALTFIAARGITGIGYGFSWMATRSFAATASQNIAGNFASLNAGIFAANICGCVLGAMLAERIGFSPVYFLVVAITVLAVCFALCIKQEERAARPNATGKELLNLKSFFGNQQVLLFLSMIVIPSTICAVGFLNYFFPLYADSMGISPSNIGRAFMIYGMCIVYLGPFLGKRIGRKASVHKAIIVAAVTAAGAMLVFSSLGGLGAAFTAVFMLGVADSIGIVSQNAYFLNLEAARALGEGKALGFFSMAWKMGQMLGPLVFGGALALGNQRGIRVVGLAYALSISLFLLMMRRRAAGRRC